MEELTDRELLESNAKALEEIQEFCTNITRLAQALENNPMLKMMMKNTPKL